MSLLRVDSSIRTDGSVSREVADALEEAWSRHHTGPVVRRDLGRDPLPAQAWATALTAGSTPEAQRTPQQRAAVAFAAALADEVLAADAIVVTSRAPPAPAGTTPPRTCGRSSARCSART